MTCENCDRPRATRSRRERTVAAAAAMLNVAMKSGVAQKNKVTLQAALQDAKVDLEIAEMELGQHENSHTMTAGAPGT